MELMSPDHEPPTRRLPTLVQYCIKVASLHVESISSLGDNVAYELVRPILECCSPDTLLRLEEASPHLKRDTNDIWKQQCIRTYAIASEPYANGSFDAPASWRDQFYTFRDTEAKRLEAIGSRIRSQRLEAEERKKEKEIKLTDRVPPMKRSRGGWGNTVSQPKTLIQRTRTEASKIQRSMFGAQMRPPMIAAKSYRVITNTNSAKIPSHPSSNSKPSSLGGSRVVVKPVPYRRPSTPQPSPPLNPAQRHEAIHVNDKPTTAVPLRPDVLDLPGRPAPPGGIAKKGPTSSLFMPKHRAHSQLPSRPGSSRGSPVK
ncbi:hypothetical protein BV25DRAFT_1854480 [Artomyces pyxidatus]|uniref:Uncharacterized protein n=1 Tax=Artomyces pyxidatus TaxID=48021 RepID=A0ACB8T408_9AGAM|nr:hypothetical protein BV25DRAFT_1854480 [Artomyces pyxidatus]